MSLQITTELTMYNEPDIKQVKGKITPSSKKKKKQLSYNCGYFFYFFYLSITFTQRKQACFTKHVAVVFKIHFTSKI